MLTSTDYIGIGVLITTATTGIIQIINTIRLKAIDVKVDGNTTAQNALIAHLQGKISDKESQIADARQVAAVLASNPVAVAPAAVVVDKLETIAVNTKETAQAVKDSKGIKK